MQYFYLVFLMQARKGQLEMVRKYWEWFILVFKFMDANENETGFSIFNESNKTFSFLFRGFLKGWTERTQKQMHEQNLKQRNIFLWIFGLWWKQMQENEIWCKDRYHLSQELELWYQNFVGTDSGWSDWWPEVWIDRPNRW